MAECRVKGTKKYSQRDLEKMGSVKHIVLEKKHLKPDAGVKNPSKKEPGIHKLAEILDMYKFLVPLKNKGY